MTNAETTLTRNPIYWFRCLGYAESFAYRAIKPLRVMLGDDETFWVVCPADAARLERAGYEYAN
jgi:hypothetical protein